jgi:hypothetical protein
MGTARPTTRPRARKTAPAEPSPVVTEDAVPETTPDMDLVESEVQRRLKALGVGEPDALPESAPVVALNTASVPFRGRDVVVVAPDVEQIMVIRRLQALFEEVSGQEVVDAQEAMDLMDEAFLAITSVIVNEADIRFIRGLMLRRASDPKRVKLADILVFLQVALRELQKANEDTMNRADRRAAAKTRGQSGGASLATS